MDSPIRAHMRTKMLWILDNFVLCLPIFITMAITVLVGEAMINAHDVTRISSAQMTSSQPANATATLKSLTQHNQLRMVMNRFEGPVLDDGKKLI